MDKSKRFYFISLAVLLVLSAYPLINGVRMAYISVMSGALEPEQYAKYVIPYAAICVSLLWYSALQPVFSKLKRLAFPVGILSAYGVFFAVEWFFETIQIHTTGMTLIDAQALTPDAAGGTATADIWQAALCIASPDMRSGSLTYASQDSNFYIVGNSLYKIHYYLISLLLITMVSGLVYGIAKMLRDNDRAQMKPLCLRGVSTATLVALCIFANTTAFFRQAAPIQTPLASVLTGIFFIALGAAAGIYAGSYLLKKGRKIGIGIPALLSLCVTALMYFGEAAMMGGNLYRFGTGWFFDGLPGIALAPVDILIVLLSGVVTWLILGATRKHENWSGKRTVISAVAICISVAVAGPVITLSVPKNEEDNTLGCYVFDKNIYTNPLSSSLAFEGMPYVYGFDENAFIIANTGTGDIETYAAEYCKTPVGADEFSSKEDDFLADWLPDLSRYKERYLIAVMPGWGSQKYGLYQMDGEIWLVELGSVGIWSIYQLKQTEATTLSDLKRASKYYADNPPVGIYENPPRFYENQMTLKDVYALARKGEALTIHDFEPFFYRLTGSDFTTRRYDVAGADTVFVRVETGKLESALLMSGRTLNPSDVIDLREGFEATAKYINPLNSFDNITIDDPHGGDGVRDLIYEYDYDGCRYYLNTKRADSVYVVFESGERMPLRQALEERRITVEDAVARGLYNISMVPIDNPLGGEFAVLHHLYTFELNGEAFYPSKSFMYVVWDDGFSVYYDIDELTHFLEWYGYDAEAEKLRESISPAEIVSIARGSYVRDTKLADAGIESDVGWALSSHTPVQFSIK